MKQAIQETLDLHHAAEAAGMSYYAYKADKKLKCPLCRYSKEFDCSDCPWKIFDGQICDSYEYSNYGASVLRLRLTSWLEKCE
jgi:hypothetical protein